MSGIGLTIQSQELDDLLVAVDALGADLTGNDLLLIAGRAVQQATKEHFELLASDNQHHETASSLGAQRTGFYEEASQAVQAPIVEGDDIVSISIAGPEGLAQRYYGGTIEAKSGGYLTIPARAETYGKRAGEFANLKLIIFGDTGLAALVYKDEPRDEGSVYYWLVRSVTQAPDPTVLPEDDELLDPALAAVQQQIRVMWDERIAA